MKKSFKFFTLFTFLFLISYFCFSENYNIDYYGVVATEVDENMSKMASDLYYTQLCEIQNFNVSDKRLSPVSPSAPSPADFVPDKLSIFTEINMQSETDAWTTTIHVYNKTLNQETTKKKEYDSFYKILMESKQSLKETLKNLIENNTSQSSLTENTTQTSSPSNISTEFLSGTWSGDEYTDKIIIMRGGRGFVIYKNGASMNIDLTIAEEGDSHVVIVSQKGKSNASFFPELPRNLALSAAVSAQPIQWTLKISDNNTLVGLKSTLLPKADSYENGNIQAVWTRLN